MISLINILQDNVDFDLYMKDSNLEYIPQRILHYVKNVDISSNIPLPGKVTNLLLSNQSM